MQMGQAHYGLCLWRDVITSPYDEPPLLPIC